MFRKIKRDALLQSQIFENNCYDTLPIFLEKNKFTYAHHKQFVPIRPYH